MRTEQTNIRLNLGAHNHYSDLAEAQGVKLATYLRNKLEREYLGEDPDSQVRRDLASIRRMVEAISGGDETGKNDFRILVEILLLLRSLSPIDTSKTVKKEMERLGYNPIDLNKES